MRCSAMDGKGNCIFSCKKIIYTHRCCYNCALADACLGCGKIMNSYAEAYIKLEINSGILLYFYGGESRPTAYI